SQDCAIAPPMVKEVIRAARKMRFIISSIVCNDCDKLLCARCERSGAKLPKSRRVPIKQRHKFVD
ncbi:MAG: hypothetical protein WBE53_25555, partial [Pseudolabrys sp.]